MKKKIVSVGVILLLAVGGYFFKSRYDYMHRLEAPVLAFPDLDGSQAAAAVTSVSGSENSRQVKTPDGELKSLQLKDLVFAGSEFTIQKGTQVWLKTAGDFFVSVEGDGVFGFEDARTNADRNQRSTVWNVKHGTFRIKSFERDGATQYWAEVRLPTGIVRMKNGELGMNIGVDGHGTVWLTRGEGEFRNAAGQVRALLLKGLDRI